MVHFSITEELDERIKRFMRQYGFGTRSEFFRFITLWYLETRNRSDIRQNPGISPLEYLSEKHPERFTRPATERD